MEDSRVQKWTPGHEQQQEGKTRSEVGMNKRQGFQVPLRSRVGMADSI